MAKERSEIDQLLGNLAKPDWPPDPSTPTKTVVKPPTRESEIRRLIGLAEAAGKKAALAQGRAILVAELAKLAPKAAVAAWLEHAESINDEVHARAIAAYGLFRAHRLLDQPVAALRFRSLAQQLLEDLEPHRQAIVRALATLSAGEEAASVTTTPALVVATDASKFHEWLKFQRKLELSKIGARFGEFITNDAGFVENARARVSELVWRLQSGLGKPANYLLEASPGAGKTFFVKQFTTLLSKDIYPEPKADAKPGEPRLRRIEKNLSTYPSIDQAFTDIVFDVLIAFAERKDVVLFVDEVDTHIEGQSLFRKLIAPMNGDLFYFMGKQISFAKQNLVAFYALSGKRDALEQTQKWPDFLSRVPRDHRFQLPSLDIPSERLLRVVTALLDGASEPVRVSYLALLFICLRKWESSRDLDQAMQALRLRNRGHQATVQIEDVAFSLSEIQDINGAFNLDLLELEDGLVELRS